MKKVLVLHFTHPEGYPPALNAINSIAEKVDHVKIITTDTLPTNWNYKSNVEYDFIDGEHDRFQFVKRSRIVKLKRYLAYIKRIRNNIKTEKPNIVLIYDNVPFLLYLIALLFKSKKHKLWYHNHDIYPLEQYPKYSILWFGFMAIQKFFNKIDFFTIPSMERVKMFPMKNFKGQFFFVPNYPSKRIIKTDQERLTNWDNQSELRLIYPGSPSIKNGFEELLNTMKQKINNKLITLTIVGETNEKYQKELLHFAKSKGVENQIFFEKRVPYVQMPQFLAKYHVGWAMYKPQDMRTATVGTASNKIYEFLANGMPILVFDNDHHRKYLSKLAAAFFTDLSTSSIIQQLECIEKNYSNLTISAHQSFEENYQFEQHFDIALNAVLS